MGQLSLFGGKRQRGRQPPSESEFTLHVMVAGVLERWATPGWFWSHLASGEKRSPRTGARLKRMGLKKGLPDFMILSLAPPRAFFLELKRRGAKQTDEQKTLGNWLISNGYEYEVCDTFEQAVAVLRRWGAVRAEVSV